MASVSSSTITWVPLSARANCVINFDRLGFFYILLTARVLHQLIPLESIIDSAKTTTSPLKMTRIHSSLLLTYYHSSAFQFIPLYNYLTMHICNGNNRTTFYPAAISYRLGKMETAQLLNEQPSSSILRGYYIGQWDGLSYCTEFYNDAPRGEASTSTSVFSGWEIGSPC